MKLSLKAPKQYICNLRGEGWRLTVHLLASPLVVGRINFQAGWGSSRVDVTSEFGGGAGMIQNKQTYASGEKCTFFAPLCAN